MKVALIGNGKTGGEVEKLLKGNFPFIVFNRSNPTTVQQLKNADIAIVFAPGTAVSGLIDTLFEAEIPAVWGSTGCQWPTNLNDRLKQKNLTWVIGENFSLSMSIIRHLLLKAGAMTHLLNTPVFTIKETHHINKKDAPSGTALAWERWIGHKSSIHSAREGDVIGRHHLQIETPNEVITLSHEAKARRCFAEGALWTAKQIYEGHFPEKGLFRFEDVVDSLINEVNNEIMSKI